MKLTSIALAAAMIASPVLAQDPAVTPAADKDAAGVYQVFRTTDNQLNCAQLTSEMNSLNATIKQQADAAAKKGGGSGVGRQIAGNTAGGLLGAAGRMGLARAIPGMGAFGGLAAVAASDAAAQGVGQAIAKGPAAPAAPASVSNEQQRMNRVAQLFATKSC